MSCVMSACAVCRDPGIHPGDVRRVRVIGYPPQLLVLVPPGLSGVAFLPTVGASCLAAALAGGDYDVSAAGSAGMCHLAESSS
jgi:hypothetical protein